MEAIVWHDFRVGNNIGNHIASKDYSYQINEVFLLSRVETEDIHTKFRIKLFAPSNRTFFTYHRLAQAVTNHKLDSEQKSTRNFIDHTIKV